MADAAFRLADSGMIGRVDKLLGSSPAPQRHVSVLYVVMVAVAMVVGAGIFRSPAEIAANAGSTWGFFGAWLAGAFISLAGALCFAELATMLPNAGGDYFFLKTTYGRSVAFLFAWARFAVINTGSIALLGFVLGALVGLAMLALGGVLLLWVRRTR